MKPKHSREASREVYLGDFVPYSGHVSDRVVKTIDGAYCATWKLEGIPFETTDAVDLDIRHDALNQMIRSLGQVSIWAHRVRRPFTDRLSTEYDSDIGRDMATRYYDGFHTSMMANEIYFTVVYRPALAKLNDNPFMRLFTGSVARSLNTIQYDERAALKVMAELTHKIETGLKKYNPTPLTLIASEKKGLTISEPLTFYGFLLNGIWRPVTLQKTSAKNTLPHVRLFFQDEKLEIRTPGTQHFAAMLDLKDYAEYSHAGILNNLLYTPFSYIETMSFAVLSKHDAKTALEIQRNQLIATEDAASSQIEEMETALDQLISGKFVLGEYHYSLAVFGDTIEASAKNLSYAETAINEAGFQAALIDLVADAAWMAQMPGNWKYRPRASKITSRNFCGLSALHGFGTGKRDKNPWGEAVSILKTPNGAPYYFNWHSSAEDEDATDKKTAANTTIIGMTGSGKTVLELFLVMMSQKYHPTTVFFDKDRGAEIAIRAFGGNYLAFKRGQPTGFNPFQMKPNEVNLRFIEQLMKTLIPRPLSPHEEHSLNNAIRQTCALENILSRSITTMSQMLTKEDPGGGSMQAHLAKWCRGNALGWVLDNPKDKIDLSGNTLFGFDDTDFLEDPEILTPVTMYLLHVTESLIDGRPFMYVMAEFWKRLESPAFSDFASNKQFTIRKQNGFGIFDTQSPAQILKTPHVAAMVEQSATQIFLPNPKADHDDYVKGFKVTEAEYNIIRTLGESSRKFLVKQQGKSTIVHLDLSGMGDILDILSGTTDNVELLHQAITEAGHAPDRWLPVFRNKLSERRQRIENRGLRG